MQCIGGSSLFFFCSLFCFCLYTKVPKVCPEVVLHEEAGVAEVAGHAVIFLQPAVVEVLVAVINDERNNVPAKAFLEHDQAADTAISVLEGMNPLKPVMEGDDVIQRHLFQIIIGRNQFF